MGLVHLEFHIASVFNYAEKFLVLTLVLLFDVSGFWIILNERERCVPTATNLQKQAHGMSI